MLSLTWNKGKLGENWRVHSFLGTSALNVCDYFHEGIGKAMSTEVPCIGLSLKFLLDQSWDKVYQNITESGMFVFFKKSVRQIFLTFCMKLYCGNFL